MQQCQQSQSQTPSEAENLETIKTTLSQLMRQLEMSSEISSKLTSQPQEVYAISKTSGTSIHPLKDSQSFKVMNSHTHIQVYSETRNLCILHSEFWGRRPTGIAKGSKQAMHCRETPVVGVRESDRLAHPGLILIFISHKGRLHGLRDKSVYSTISYGYTIYIKLRPITDRTNIAIRQGKQPHVTNVMKDTESVNDMPPKKQQQRDQLRLRPPNPNTRA
jgi:hypothetical protein